RGNMQSFRDNLRPHASSRRRIPELPAPGLDIFQGKRLKVWRREVNLPINDRAYREKCLDPTFLQLISSSNQRVLEKTGSSHRPHSTRVWRYEGAFSLECCCLCIE